MIPPGTRPWGRECNQNGAIRDPRRVHFSSGLSRLRQRQVTLSAMPAPAHSLETTFERLIFLIGVALTHTFGRMVGDERQGWSLLGAMVVLFAVGLCVVYSAEAALRQARHRSGGRIAPGRRQYGRQGS